MGPQLHETGYGRKLFEVQIPEIIKALSRIADALEEQNAILKERNEHFLSAHEELEKMKELPK